MKMSLIERAVSDLRQGHKEPVYYNHYSPREQALYVSAYHSTRDMSRKCVVRGCRERCASLAWEGRSRYCMTHNKCRVCFHSTSWAEMCCYRHDQNAECRICGERTRWAPSLCQSCHEMEESIMKIVGEQ